MAGLPATLLALGDASIIAVLGSLDEAPSIRSVLAALTRPDDGTLAFTALQVLAWAVWAFLTVSIILEVVSRARQVTAPHVPGLRLPQSAARHLVGAALLLFVATPLAVQGTAAAAQAHTRSLESAPVTGSPAVIDVPLTAQPSGGQLAAAHPAPPDTPPAPAPQAHTVAHTVVPGDSLWSIAAAHLGAGARYPEIAALNSDVLGDRPGFLRPGTVLQLPAPTPDPAGAGDAAGAVEGSTYVVVAGDTLSGIAQQQLGEAARYPEIVAASQATIQPGGARLTDPDVIDVGWTLTLPGPPAADPAVPDPAVPDPAVPDPALPDPDPPGLAAPATPAGPPAATAPAAPSRSDVGRAGGGPDAATSDPDADPRLSVPPEVSDDADVKEELDGPDWLLTGLTGGGVLLAGSLLLMVQRRRRAQARARRPGRTIARPAPALMPVEKSMTVSGSVSAPTVDLMDTALRRLGAARASAGLPMPQLAAVQLTSSTIVLHLSSPDNLSAPWQSTGTATAWRLRRDGATDTEPTVDGDSADMDATAVGPAPYPLLVTIGASDTGDVWLLNCEDLVLSITGDPVFGADAARYIAAEIACNPWSAEVRVDCHGIAEEIGPMNPERIRVPPPEQDPSAEVLADATAIIDRVAETTGDVTTARAHQHGDDIWPARLLITTKASAAGVDAGAEGAVSVPFGKLLELMTSHAGHTATGVVVVGEVTDTADAVMHMSCDGRVSMPHAGLDLVAVGLTSDEARGCAALLAQGEDLDDTAIPEDQLATTGWRSYADEAGALRQDLTLPRTAAATEGQVVPVETPVTSILDGPDEEYLRAAATIVEDLDRLAPRTPAQLRLPIENADPTLDEDVAAWFAADCALPRLTLLGPVRARTRGVPVTKRKPFYTEALAYLAVHPHGVTPAEFADAMLLSAPGARNAIHMVRQWLGVDPRTGRRFLPDAREAPGAVTRGLPVYQVVGVLVDADLFRRLRLRAQARGAGKDGADGIDDLVLALSLVTGKPFDQLRPGGWAWLSDGDRIDQHMLCAVVDVAHLVVTHSLRAGDLTRARAAAELAARAGPYEEIPRLDLTAVATAEGRHADADRILLQDICNRSDGGEPPEQLSDRTERIIEQRGWLATERAAS